MPSRKKNQKKRSIKKRGGSMRNSSKKMSRNIKKKGGGCGCDQKHFVGGYGAASFRGDPSQYTYALNKYENDPISPENVTNARNLAGGSKSRRRKIAGGAISDVLGKNNGSDFFSSFGTSNAAENASRIANGQSSSILGPFPTPTSSTYNANRPPLV